MDCLWKLMIQIHLCLRFVVLLAMLFEANRISREDCVHRVLRATRMEVWNYAQFLEFMRFMIFLLPLWCSHWMVCFGIGDNAVGHIFVCANFGLNWKPNYDIFKKLCVSCTLDAIWFWCIIWYDSLTIISTRKLIHHSISLISMFFELSFVFKLGLSNIIAWNH